MNPIKEKIIETLESIPAEYDSLKEHSFKYLNYCSIIDVDGKIQMGHRPWVAPYNFAITLFTPAKKSWFSKFKQIYGISIPTVYQKFLLISNGSYFYDLDLFGIIPSLLKDDGVLDKSKLNCLDLGLANGHWIKEYNVDDKFFHFGGRRYSYNENVGYFILKDGSIEVIRKCGGVISHYNTFPEFLEMELKIAENIMKEETPDDWWS